MRSKSFTETDLDQIKESCRLTFFSVAAASYGAMLADTRDQSIIISGESGAGKTEATKRILTYFANLQQNELPKKDGNTTMSIEDQVLRSNPILEAFGNAKTARNDNSSRFGKYIDIQFDNRGKLSSAKISSYLLEKSRIVKQQPGERGYHAFYQLCAGARSLGRLASVLSLSDQAQHRYVCGTTMIDGVDDRQDFTEMVDCMHSLCFSAEERESTFKIAAAVLHLGDLDFEEHPNSADGSRITQPQAASKLCELFDVNGPDLAKTFQFKTLEDPVTKKIIDMPQDPAGSSDRRHSMARAVYTRLFDWLVWRINQSTIGSSGKQQFQKIGLLDIYGFEVFEWNSFEQLCINFANEKLQQHFNSHMFTLEQQLYSAEGITWSHIKFQDNGEIIDSLEKKPLGLFSIIDSECLMPNATDTTALSKIRTAFQKSTIIFKPSKFASSNFAIAHYAGEVIYDIESFLEKNTDKLHADIINLLKSSRMPLLKTLFSDPLFAGDKAAPGSGIKASPQRAAVSSRGKATSDRAKQNVTVSMMFRQQLEQLVQDLNKTHPSYIRCIKPNANKQAHDFDSLDVRRQLRCAGMLEAIRIRKAGYSVRLQFKEFFNRFRLLCPLITAGTRSRSDPDFKELSRRLLMQMEARYVAEKQPLEEKTWQIGRSKVFLKDELQKRLEKSMGESVKAFVVRIQKRWRGYAQRKQYIAMRKAAEYMNTAFRTFVAKERYKEVKQRYKAAVMLQAGLRTAQRRIVHLQRCQGAILLQRRARGWLCRRRIGQLKGKMAAARIEKLRREEESKRALELAAKHAEEKARQLAQVEAQRELEKEDMKRGSAELEQLRREVLDVRGENVRMQEQLKELAEIKREKSRLEEELLEAKRDNAELNARIAMLVDGGANTRQSIPVPSHARVGAVQREAILRPQPSKRHGDKLAVTCDVPHSHRSQRLAGTLTSATWAPRGAGSMNGLSRGLSDDGGLDRLAGTLGSAMFTQGTGAGTYHATQGSSDAGSPARVPDIARLKSLF
mmetsp:Transcript_75596/g.149412  ORF Transcript_75596/g.149412 Transcript_75596/m.149412 type:complete len:1015 (+) Transcript_75596:70-3114(+)